MSELSFPGKPNLSELRIGFTVGITKEGVLEFKVQGEDITPAELAGLLYYADFQVKKLLDTQFKSADTLCLLGLAKVMDKLNKLEGDKE